MPRFASLLVAVAGFTVVGCGGSKPTAPAPEQSQPALPATEPTRPTTPPEAKPTGSTIRGVVDHPGKKGQSLRVGYIELLGEAEVGDSVPYEIPAADEVTQVSSNPPQPRKSVLSFDKGATSFEFTGLPAGTYFVFARLDGGPAAWAKVELKASSTVTQDFKLVAGKGGTVEVTTPAGFDGEVRLSPSDVAVPDDAAFAAGRMGTQLDLGGKAKSGKVTIPEVPPGKYTLFAIPGVLAPRGSVEAIAGKTATTELEKEKK